MKPLKDKTDDELRAMLSTHEGKLEVLGKSEGIATQWKGSIEIPQSLYERGFINHKVARCGRDYARPYDEVVFDRHPELSGRRFEL